MDEIAYDRRRLDQWLTGAAQSFSRRDLFRLTAAVAAATAVGTATGPTAAAANSIGPIVKPLPPALLTALGTNAEMRWSSMRHQGHLVPVDRFFVRNHTSTPRIDPGTWR